jgi:transposase-like protein
MAINPYPLTTTPPYGRRSERGESNAIVGSRSARLWRPPRRGLNVWRSAADIVEEVERLESCGNDRGKVLAMLKARPEELTVLLRDVLSSDGDTHEMRLGILARETQELVAGPLQAYHGYDEMFVETFLALDRAGLLGVESFRHAVEATADRADGALHLANMCAELFDEIADTDAEQEERLRELSAQWRELLANAPDGEDTINYASVADVAKHFDVTPQAVYRWIDRGKIEARQRPGGSYRIPVEQFERMDAEALNAATRPRPESSTTRWRSDVTAARPERPHPAERLRTENPLEGL